MNVNLLTEQHLEFLNLKGGCQANLSLNLSKYHIVGNHVSRLNCLDVYLMMKDSWYNAYYLTLGKMLPVLDVSLVVELPLVLLSFKISVIAG